MNDSAGIQARSTMTLADICKILNAEVICGEDKLDEQVTTACGCDLMSDVLAFTLPGSILLTGLTNQQVVRTAEMLDLKAVIIVRNKRPDESMVELACSKGLPILLSPYPLYECCGMLFAAGLKGCNGSVHAKDESSQKIEPAKPGEMMCGAPGLGD